MPERASRSLPPPTQAPVPRASDTALARRPVASHDGTVDRSGAGPRPGPAGLRHRQQPRWASRATLSSVTALAVILASLGATAAEAGQRPADPVAPRLAAAEADPSPVPSSEPTPRPTPTPAPTAPPTPTPTPRPTPWPTPQGVKGLDVSHWNGYPDFDQLYDAGMRFVFSKASQGTTITDSTFRRHTREARAAGLTAGSYHFFDYTRSGRAQARHYLATLRSTTGLSALLPLVVDVETLSSLGTPNRAEARSRLHALLDELYAQTGRYPMIYTSRYMWERVLGAPRDFGRYPLWVACWKCDTIHLPAGWSRWHFWQVGQFRFSSTLRLDGNVWRGTMTQLRERTARPLRLARGAEWSATRSVEADLRGYDGVEIRYASGDAPWGPWASYGRRPSLTLSPKQGQQDVRLQLRSFRGIKSPVIRDSIRLDTVAPTVWGPRVSIRQGVRVPRDVSRVQVQAIMGSKDATSGVASTGLTNTCDGKVRATRASSASNPSLTTLIERKGCTLSARASDVAGHRTTRALSPGLTVLDLRRSDPAVTFGPGWTVLSATGAVGRSLARASTRDATLRVHFDGTQFALVARRGPAGGKLRVILDGRQVSTVDLYAASGDPRRVLYTLAVPKGKHTVKLQATGTGRPASSGSTVWLDALLVLDRRK